MRYFLATGGAWGLQTTQPEDWHQPDSGSWISTISSCHSDQPSARCFQIIRRFLPIYYHRVTQSREPAVANHWNLTLIFRFNKHQPQGLHSRFWTRLVRARQPFSGGYIWKCNQMLVVRGSAAEEGETEDGPWLPRLAIKVTHLRGAAQQMETIMGQLFTIH